MANSEKAFQTELLTQMRQQGWHAFKVTTPFMAGVPDLYVKAPGLPACWIELKYQIAKGRAIPINLSVLQRKFIRDEHKSGGKAGWAICLRQVDHWVLYGSNQEDDEEVTREHFIDSRLAGRPWSIQKLMEALCA
jgi:hypothetical protein